MNKNLIPIIARELGVGVNEEFKLKSFANSVYKFTEQELLQSVFNKDWFSSSLSLNLLFDSEIVKLPFEPKRGDGYWTYSLGDTLSGWGVCSEVWDDDAYDYIHKTAGCIFRTKEEAIAALPAKYEELTGKEWTE